MGKTKESEAERHRKLRVKRKEELKKYKALWEFLETKHPKTLQDFEVEYAARGTSTSINHATTSTPINHATTQTEESSQEVMSNTAEPRLELTTSEEPLQTPQPLLEEILALITDCNETVLYNECLAELNCINF